MESQIEGYFSPVGKEDLNSLPIQCPKENKNVKMM